MADPFRRKGSPASFSERTCCGEARDRMYRGHVRQQRACQADCGSLSLINRASYHIAHFDILVALWHVKRCFQLTTGNGNTRYSNLASTKQLRNPPNSCSEKAVDSLGRVLRKQRMIGQTENTGVRYRVDSRKCVHWLARSQAARSASRSTEFTRKMAKAPAITSPALSLERIFVFDCLVEAEGLEPSSKKG